MSPYFSFLLRSNVVLFRGLVGLNRFRFQASLEQMVQIGVLSFPTVAIALFFMGVVLTMQGAEQLQKYGLTHEVANIVAFGMLREIGPLITSFLVIGRSGSAITAELGTMKVAEEIKALEIMGIDPIRFLVAPRMFALIIMLPLLTVFGVALGLIGGWTMATFGLHLSPYSWVTNAAAAVTLWDFYTGLLKGVVFGGLIATICCYYGMKVTGGAEGVGQSTTAAVVTAMLATIIMNAFLTAFFFFIA